MTESHSASDCDTAIESLRRERFETLDRALARIIEVAAKTLDVDRVSIWFCSHGFGRLNRVQTYPQADGNGKSFSLDVSQRPEYSTALGQRFGELIESSVDAIGMASAEGILEYLNPGRPRAARIGTRRADTGRVAD